MTNGFYNSNKLTKAKKRAFIKDAINLSYTVLCQSKYTEGAPFTMRGTDTRLTVASSLDILLNTKDSRLDCIDRNAYKGYNLTYRGAIPNSEYEICFHTTNGPNNGWLLLYIFVNEESFINLIGKYNLSLIEY
jgi:hypothetical protein